MKDTSEYDNEECRRDYATRIIAGEYKAALVVMIDNDENRHIWYDGSGATCVGLARIAEAKLLRQQIGDDE